MSIKIEKTAIAEVHLELPVLPLRDIVVFPNMVIPLFVGRKKSIQALELAMERDKQVLLVAQRNPNEDDPKIKEIYQIGCVASILQLFKLPDGTVKVLIEGADRAKSLKYREKNGIIFSTLEIIAPQFEENRELEIMVRATLAQFEQYVKLNRKIPPEVLTALAGIDEAGRLADTIAAHMSLKIEEKQKILEMNSALKRLEHLMGLMDSEIDLMQVEKRIRGRVKSQMEKTQREYFLNEQMKAIQKEMGELDDAPNEIEELTKKIETVGLSKEAKDKAKNELNKLKMMSPMSAEATVSRNYLDCLVGLPWKKRSKLASDLKKARQILDDEHYGLEKVKERIIEFLAVQQRVHSLKGPVLCLVGPPGVGKTSLGQSIAKATGRLFARMSLGGVRDEAEIRGHRRTYIGSMPGKILQKLSKVGVRNPLFLLDEIDKMAMDFRGDPASALLEVLDPEQNHNFNDHYIEVDYDLSDVMFIATANSLNIPDALLDRMEVIRIPGYTEDEKVHIAQQHLIPKQLINNGISDKELSISDNTLQTIIRHYTREAGVRNLERELNKIARKVVTEVSLTKDKKKRTITPRNLEKYLGIKKFRYGLAEEYNQIGQVTGLAWTQVGGELLTIEAAAVPGKGKTTQTGKLGEIMQESISAAMTVVRGRARSLGIAADFYEHKDLHIHVPEGATPKDGPSAGIAMCTALVSVLTEIPVKADVAMTGEITLRGEVLPIGGLKEKLLAAHRGGIRTVIIPEENKHDLKEIPDNVTHALKIIPVRWIENVLEIALERMPQPLSSVLDDKEIATPVPVIKETGKRSAGRTH